MKVVSAKGKVLDVSQYLAENETAPAVGNARMNARGDIIGEGGKIVQSREQIATEYHRLPSKSVRQVSLKDIAGEVMSPEQAVARIDAANMTAGPQAASPMVMEAAQGQTAPVVSGETTDVSSTSPVTRRRKIVDGSDD
jgi:hypothetical protein